METEQTLQVQHRQATGKGVARKLRAQGLIPAVCYGELDENLPVTINPEEFAKIQATPRGLNSVFHIEFDGGKKIQNVMLSDYQVDPVTRDLLHADLVAVDMDKPIVVTVPIEPTGRAAGVRMGGKLRVIQPRVKVRCRPSDIPEIITVDVTNLGPEGAIMASHLPFPEGVEPGFKGDHALMRIEMPRVVAAKTEEKGKKAKKTASEAEASK
ncbi:MAG: 50S ribosomal protein L25 [Bradymonadaceae bacterium]